jgi:hypothetical protein
MQPRDDANEEGETLPTDGLEVEETRDEDTVRRFMADWRKRLSAEYAQSILQAPGDDRWRPKPR